MTLRDLKVGDEVFVVHQLRSGMLERKTATHKIIRVDRKYAELDSNLHGEKFCRDSGRSVHKPDHNQRINGFGFDVYRNEAEYRAEVHAANEYQRLQSRICSRFHRLKNLPPDVVGDIHAVLDKHEKGGE